MNKYLQKFGAATGADRATHRVARVLGAETSPWAKTFDKPSTPDVTDGVGTLAGAAAGAVYGHKHGGHWLLGGIGGASLGANVPALIFRPEERPAATRNLIVTGSGIAGSLLFKENRAFGFLLGYLGAAAMTYFGDDK